VQCPWQRLIYCGAIALRARGAVDIDVEDARAGRHGAPAARGVDLRCVWSFREHL
jgi:hypothetical protein